MKRSMYFLFIGLASLAWLPKSYSAASNAALGVAGKIVVAEPNTVLRSGGKYQLAKVFRRLPGRADKERKANHFGVMALIFLLMAILPFTHSMLAVVFFGAGVIFTILGLKKDKDKKSAKSALALIGAMVLVFTLFIIYLIMVAD